MSTGLNEILFELVDVTVFCKTCGFATEESLQTSYHADMKYLVVASVLQKYSTHINWVGWE